MAGSKEGERPRELTNQGIQPKERDRLPNVRRSDLDRQVSKVFNKETALCLLTTAVDESNRFFNKDITSLEVPDEFYKTQERMSEIGLTQFNPLVLQQKMLIEDDPWWEGKVKPEQLLWEHAKSILKPESAMLQKGIYLIDGRTKPDYQEGQQMYEDDGFMGEMLKGLRRKGIIEKDSYYPIGSRFNISPGEIERAILPELEKAIGKDTLGSDGRVINNPYKIFNIAGNMRYPEWGKTDTEEWFGDTFLFDNYIRGGSSDSGGLASVCFVDQSFHRYGSIGFRPLIAFFSKS